MVNRQRLHSVVKELREKLPPKYPVSVRIRKMAKQYASCQGLTYKKGRQYLIYLNQSLNWDGAIDSLLHEWAHTLAWKDEIDHDFRWGMAFAKCWREIIDSESEDKYGKGKARRIKKTSRRTPRRIKKTKRQRNGSSSKKSKR